LGDKEEDERAGIPVVYTLGRRCMIYVSRILVMLSCAVYLSAF